MALFGIEVWKSVLKKQNFINVVYKIEHEKHNLSVWLNLRLWWEVLIFYYEKIEQQILAFCKWNFEKILWSPKTIFKSLTNT